MTVVSVEVKFEIARKTMPVENEEFTVYDE